MPFNLLSPAVKRYIREKKWSAFRPIQEAAIFKILNTDNHYILSSRTASGKTEAAFLPVISRLTGAGKGCEGLTVNYRWAARASAKEERDANERPGVSVLYISPLIALINHQLWRIEDLCGTMDMKVTRWHGEADRSEKKRLLDNPEGILLITPESLESLFVNNPLRLAAMFSNLSFVIVDEIHSFLGTRRGCHLKSLLHRLKSYGKKKTRFIGLSATLGDFEEARDFYGEPEKTKILRDRSGKEVSALFHYFPALQPESPGKTDEGREEEGRSREGKGSGAKMLPESLVLDLFENTKSKRSLIFPNSRARVEEVTVRLKKLAKQAKCPHRYFAHHSSVSRELREHAERSAKRSSRYDFSIICTSTLELGIDLGEVDLIVQVNSTFSVSSLVQRFGRSGRQDGLPCKLLLYTTDPWSLLQAVACLELYKEGFVEPMPPLLYPVDIVFHQVLSVLKEKRGISTKDLLHALQSGRAFGEIAPGEYEELLQFMIGEGYIEDLKRELIPGYKAEELMNSLSFYGVFRRETGYDVIFEDRVIGTLEFSHLLKKQENDGGKVGAEGISRNIFLSGKTWRVKTVDRRSKQIHVEEAMEGEAPNFTGSGGAVHRRVREKMWEILTGDFDPVYCDDEGRETLRVLKAHFATAYRPVPGLDRPVFEAGGIEFFTFCGSRINRTLQHLFRCLLGENSFYYDEKRSMFRLPCAPEDVKSLLKDLLELIAGFEKEPAEWFMEEEAIALSKWSEYLPPEFKEKMVLLDYFDIPGTKEFLAPARGEG
ncbi:MAG: DEAD/DEAH box helicase [bacterium]|nr:DEAD/DEAH box helicase [bacterium]